MYPSYQRKVCVTECAVFLSYHVPIYSDFASFNFKSAKAALLDKNVVQNVKLPDKTIKKVPVDTEEKIIKLAAQLGSIDLSVSYGVPPGLAETMDIAAQVAVAAGMEALKSAGLVSGKSNDPSEWKLPEKYRDTTGVVYASSFPAMDAVSIYSTFSRGEIV